MQHSRTGKYSVPAQYITSIALVLVVSTACFFSAHLIGGYRVAALLLLMTVSLLAMLFDIFPVLVAAVLSAVAWNFFFIPPLYTFHIGNAEDLLVFILYFVIALVNAVLTFKIRSAEKKAQDKEEKENTIRLYNTLLNSLSHELRTPVAAIVGAVDTLKENKDRLTAAQHAELLAQIDMAGLRLDQQVENLLSMSRLESGMLQLKTDWCDVNELIFSVLQKLAPVSGQHNIHFIPAGQLPLFRLDGGLMEQVLYNILHNAVQYTPPHTQITVEAAYKEGHCIITITDNGPGFPGNEIPLLFNKFYRLPGAKAGGSGLGLSIAKGFVEAHNGHIRAGNSDRGGAEFIIDIPADTSFITQLKNE